MQPRRVIAVGGSAGALDALKHVLGGLRDTPPAALLVVLHVSAQAPSLLARILQRATQLRVCEAADGVRLASAHAYVAPPDRHLLVHDGHMRLSVGPRENGHRPAIDPLFRSVARAYGERAVGVVLSGNLDDGTEGLLAIKAAGGVTVVQSPDDALYTGMVESAMRTVQVDHVVPASEMAALLAKLSDGAEPPAPARAATMRDEQFSGKPGDASPFVCPDCGGTLFEKKDGDLTHYRCRVGHAYSPEALDGEMSQELEGALFGALRVLQEHADLMRRAAERARKRRLDGIGAAYEHKAEDDDRRAEVLRTALGMAGR